MTDVVLFQCCCEEDDPDQPSNCDEWFACAPQTMTLTVSYVHRVTRIVGGSPSSPFIEEEIIANYSATMTLDPVQRRLVGPVVGSYSFRSEVVDFSGLCPGNTFCPSCGNCCSNITKAFTFIRSGRIEGEATVGCGGSFFGSVNTAIGLGLSHTQESCQNLSGTCPVDPCDPEYPDFTFYPPYPQGSSGWIGCADSQVGRQQYMDANSFSTTNSYEDTPIGAPNDVAFFCYDPYATTDTNPFGIICACLGVLSTDPYEFPVTLFSCSQTIIQEDSLVVTIS